MKTIKSILLLTLAIVVASLTSCDSPLYPDGESGKETGRVSLARMAVSVSNAEQVIESKASVEVGTFTVNIKNEEGAVVSSFKYAEMPELLALEVGKYTVEAYNAEEQLAAFDAPYFYGVSKEFEVKANEITDVDPIVCKLSNVKVGIFYSDELKKLMGNDVVVTVKVADSEELDFVADETRAGYFKYVEGNKTIVATFSGTVDGYKVSDYKVLANAVAPGNYHKITFSIKDAPLPPDENGQIGSSGLNMDATVTRVDFNGNVNPGDEDIIDPDDFLDVERSTVNFKCDASSENITVKASGAFTATSDADWCTITNLSGKGFTINATANSDKNNSRTAVVTVAMGAMSKTIQVTQAKYTEASTEPEFKSENIDLFSGAYNDAAEFGESPKKAAVVNIIAPKGIKKLHVTIDSETLSEMLPGVGLSTDFDLATGMDDAGKDLTEALVGLGFPVADGGQMEVNGEMKTYGSVMNQTSVVFDITSFMDLMAIPGPGKSNFKVKVTDSTGATAEVTIRFEVK